METTQNKALSIGQFKKKETSLTLQSHIIFKPIIIVYQRFKIIAYCDSFYTLVWEEFF